MGRKGMTLIEIMIVVALIAIMAAVATAIYRPYIRKARRSDAFTALKACYTAQEMYKAENGRYSDNQSALSGCPTQVPQDDPYYLIQLVPDPSGNGTWFSFVAVPQGSQAEDLAFCIDEEGREYWSENATVSRCCPTCSPWQQQEWERL